MLLRVLGLLLRVLGLLLREQGCYLGCKGLLLRVFRVATKGENQNLDFRLFEFSTFRLFELKTDFRLFDFSNGKQVFEFSTFRVNPYAAT